MSRDQLTRENLNARLSLPKAVLALLSVGAELLVQGIDYTNGRITVQIPVGELPSKPGVFYTFVAYSDAGIVQCKWIDENRKRSGSFAVKGETQAEIMGELESHIRVMESQALQ